MQSEERRRYVEGDCGPLAVVAFAVVLFFLGWFAHMAWVAI